MVAHAFTPSTEDTEAGGALWVWGQPGLHGEFHYIQDYVERPQKNQK